MKNQEIVDFLNDQWPPSVSIFNGRAINFDQKNLSLEMVFRTNPDFCHSGDVVQGGFISGMLDATMAYAAIGMPELCDIVATLEIKVSFLQVGRDGEFIGKGRVIHAGRSIAYLEGQLFQDDRLVAAATSTVKLISSK